jgi:hypothetical protein
MPALTNVAAHAWGTASNPSQIPTNAPHSTDQRVSLQVHAPADGVHRFRPVTSRYAGLAATIAASFRTKISS